MEWDTLFNGITAISTFIMMIATSFMAYFAWKALGTWKNQQKREKLISLFETLNKYLQELRYYELESTIFSKSARNNNEEGFNNNDLIERQIKIIDIELAQSDGETGLCFKNWLIDHDEQKVYLDNISKNLQKYRFELYKHVELKIKFYLNKNNHAEVLYGSNEQKDFADEIRNKVSDFTEIKNKITKEINKFKEINKKLLK